MLVRVESITMFAGGFGNAVLTCSCGRRNTAVNCKGLLQYGLTARCSRCREPFSQGMDDDDVARIAGHVVGGSPSDLEAVARIVAGVQRRARTVSNMVPVACPHCGVALLDEERQEAARAVVAMIQAEKEKD